MSGSLHIGINALQLSSRNSGIGNYICHIVSSLLALSDDQYTIYLSRGNMQNEWYNNQNVCLKEKPFRKEQFYRRNIYELSGFGLDLSREGLSLFWSPDTKVPLLMPKNIPFIVTVHDLAILREPATYLLSRVVYWRKLFKLAIQRSACVVAISNNTKKDLIDLMGVSPEKIRVVYNGVSPCYKPVENPFLLEQVASKHHLPARFLLFVGLISPRKNIKGILNAFSILKKTYRIPHRLVIVGEKGWRYQADLSLVKKLGLEEDIIFTGYVDDKDLPAIYSLADVFIFPSLYEGFGLPVMEAMACGTPVVTSNASALAEVVGTSGVLINPHIPEEIAYKVNLILSDPQLSSLLTVAGKERAKMFSWEKAARELIEIFHEITTN